MDPTSNELAERWRGKVALVTGASSGIGASVARTLLRGGMRVAVCARRTEPLETLAEGRQEASLMAVRADLRSTADISALFERIREEWGGVDVLVNNAGLGHKAPLIDAPTELWREMLEVNVLALCVCTREAISDMRRRSVAGHVVHISSMAAHRVPPGSGVYSATKFAVRALTEALRQELRAAGSSIRVSSISPGFVETEFAARYHKSEDAARKTYGRFPVLQADDVAGAVAYVLSCPPHVQVHDVLVRPTEQPG